MLKPFDPNVGVLIDENFAVHQSQCAQCTKADEDLSKLCLEGSVLWKREHPGKSRPRRKPDDRTFDWIEEVTRADGRKRQP